MNTLNCLSQRKIKVPCLGMLLLCLTACKTTNDLPQARQFLQQNKATILLENTNSVQHLFADSLLQANEVFLSSESHATASNTDICFFFLKFFKDKTDFRYLLTEHSYAASRLINQYLRNGDEAFLKRIYQQFRGTFEWTQERMEFWQKLRDYNLTLPEERRIVPIGCDIEHQTGIAYSYLIALLPKSEVPDKLSNLLKEIQNLHLPDYRTKQGSQQIDSLLTDIRIRRADYEAFLGKNLNEFEFTLQNMMPVHQYYLSNNLENREKAICENFRQLYARLPKGKFYGQWGSYHTLQKAPYLTLAKYLQHDSESPCKHKVISIYSLYENSYYLDNESKKPKPIKNAKSVKLWTSVTDANLTLFRLLGESTPFTQKLYAWASDETFNAGVTTDYFQYLLVIKNSPAMKPLE